MARLKAKRATTEIELSQAEALAITGDPDKRLIQKQAIQQLSQNITERQANILSMRFDEGLTYREIGKELGVTQERVRQIELKALKKMRSRAKMLGVKGEGVL
jgi:RNA polymerase primary sigma factor